MLRAFCPARQITWSDLKNPCVGSTSRSDSYRGDTSRTVFTCLPQPQENPTAQVGFGTPRPESEASVLSSPLCGLRRCPALQTLASPSVKRRVGFKEEAGGHVAPGPDCREEGGARLFHSLPPGALPPAASQPPLEFGASSSASARTARAAPLAALGAQGLGLQDQRSRDSKCSSRDTSHPGGSGVGLSRPPCGHPASAYSPVWTSG